MATTEPSRCTAAASPRVPSSTARRCLANGTSGAQAGNAEARDEEGQARASRVAGRSDETMDAMPSRATRSAAPLITPTAAAPARPPSHRRSRPLIGGAIRRNAPRTCAKQRCPNAGRLPQHCLGERHTDLRRPDTLVTLAFRPVHHRHAHRRSHPPQRRRRPPHRPRRSQSPRHSSAPPRPPTATRPVLRENTKPGIARKRRPKPPPDGEVIRNRSPCRIVSTRMRPSSCSSAPSGLSTARPLLPGVPPNAPQRLETKPVEPAHP